MRQLVRGRFLCKTLNEGLTGKPQNAKRPAFAGRVAVPLPGFE